jgi:nicotinamide-nucleotide amidase
MTGPVRVEVLTVGDELLAGVVTDTNAAWLARRLTEAGLPVGGITVVGDDAPAIAAAARAALARAGAVVVTGGLGPTSDDVTEEALAPLGGSPDALDLLPNPVGTAPGLRIEADGGVLYAVPGVPREMTAMVTASVLPDLLRRAGATATVLTRTLHVALLGEPAVAARLEPFEQSVSASDAPIRVAYLAAPGEVRVRLTVTAEGPEEAGKLVEPWVARAAELLGDHLSGVDETLDATVHRLLAARQATVAVAESLTGGLLGGVLTAMPGSSATFRGGVTAYATELKAGLLGVDGALLGTNGAVDAQVAAQMAAGVRTRLGATYGLATTGVAGPEPQEGKPPGTVHVAVAGPDGIVTASPRLNGERGRIRTLSVAHTLDLARRRLAGLPGGRERGDDYSVTAKSEHKGSITCSWARPGTVVDVRLTSGAETRGRSDR